MTLAFAPARAEARDGLTNAGALAKPVCTTGNPRTIWAFEPHCSGVAVQNGFPAEMRYNALGLRDRDYLPFPSPGKFRILVLGSSGLVGPGLAEPMNPVRRMEAELRRRGHDVEVINGATEGYFTTQNAIRLHELVEAYHPNLVAFDLLTEGGVYSDAALESVTTFEGERPVSVTVDPLRVLPGRLRGMVSDSASLRPKLVAIEELSRRIRATWTARLAAGFLGKESESAGARFLGPTLRLLRYMRNEAQRAQAQFRILHDPRAYVGTVWAVPPGMDFALASGLSRLAVPIYISPEQMTAFLAKEGLPTATLMRRRGENALTLGADYHYSPTGALEAGIAMAAALEPVLPAARRGVARADGAAKRPTPKPGKAP